MIQCVWRSELSARFALKGMSMDDAREAARKAFEKVLDQVSTEKRELNAWEGECLRAALIMMVMNDHSGALRAIESCARVPPGFDVNLQPAFTIEGMRACLAMVTDEGPH